MASTTTSSGISRSLTRERRALMSMSISVLPRSASAVAVSRDHRCRASAPVELHLDVRLGDIGEPHRAGLRLVGHLVQRHVGLVADDDAADQTSPSRSVIFTRRLTLRRQCRGSVRGRPTPGDDTSSTYGCSPMALGVVEGCGQHGRERCDVVESDAPVAVDQHAYQAPASGGLHVDRLRGRNPLRHDNGRECLLDAVGDCGHGDLRPFCCVSAGCVNAGTLH